MKVTRPTKDAKNFPFNGKRLSLSLVVLVGSLANFYAPISRMAVAQKPIGTGASRVVSADEARYIELSQQAEEKDHQEASRLQPTRAGVSGQTQQPSGRIVSNAKAFDPAKMESYLKQELTKKGAVGFSYAIVQSGQLVKSGAQGWARAPWEGKPLNPDPNAQKQPSVGLTATKRMTVASISKPITAVAVMKLVEQKKLSLDDKFYPLIKNKFPVAGKGVENVTIRQLLTHTSGLKAGVGCGNLPGLLSQGTSGNPYDYENSNFCLLREVIEKVSGQNYVSYVQTEILSKMTIANMSCQPDVNNPTLYYNTSKTPGKLWGDYSDSCSAFGWYASATDLAKFLAYIRYHKVLSKPTTEQMLSEGLGWKKTSGTRGTYYQHGGDWIASEKKGFTGVIMHFPDGIDAVVLVNTRGDFNKTTVMKNAYEAAFK
ncbi:serine hydrolase domain-containing protein [Coleofasciculus sp. FACHB-1120]|uniref:serine hydrolase domain-containing protein n=1 Tax=Coleofasciculus sp. FACHB-1120 TaxID=2692783 RepID=UPI001686A1B3|nr:serine hydrolase domain-containing protein [Coleofasciculus sp. FACHB-1120]MBD2741480.1 beta-lactamase family protein [Coleofasciculus sp. FACHB-1120]